MRKNWRESIKLKPEVLLKMTKMNPKCVPDIIHKTSIERKTVSYSWIPTLNTKLPLSNSSTGENTPKSVHDVDSSSPTTSVNSRQQELGTEICIHT